VRYEHLANTSLYARAPKGERSYAKAPRNWGKNLTLIASLSLERLSQQNMVVEGATDTKAFESYVEHFLCPELSRQGRRWSSWTTSALTKENVFVPSSNRRERTCSVHACLLSGLQPHRGSLLQDKELFEEGQSEDQRVAA
jgi:hypothetical protein